MSRVTRTPEQTAAIESWRVRYETDPLVTFVQIAESAGVSPQLARWYANARGWYRPPELHKVALQLASRRGSEARWAGRVTAPHPAHRPPSAPASVWDWGSMHVVVTSRGKHRRIEVPT
jgi:hypothetical protein